MERIVSSSALKKMTKPGSRDPETDMKKLVGLSVVKEQMAVMAARMEYDRENRKKKKHAKEEDISRHMIFSGAPGTGKTTVARIMTGFLYKNGFIRKSIYNGRYCRKNGTGCSGIVRRCFIYR